MSVCYVDYVLRRGKRMNRRELETRENIEKRWRRRVGKGRGDKGDNVDPDPDPVHKEEEETERN